MGELKLGNLHIEVIRKQIKNLYLRVDRDGSIRLSAPARISDARIEAFARSKISWIIKQKEKQENMEILQSPDLVNGDFIYFKGESYLLWLIERDTTPHLIRQKKIIQLNVRPGTDRVKKQQIIDNWYRARLKEETPAIIRKWEEVLDVRVNEFRVKKMTTKWGTCNIKAKRIWLSLELAKKPHVCLEYIIVHEMVHLLERGHNSKFYSLMNKFMPEWKTYKKILENQTKT